MSIHILTNLISEYSNSLSVCSLSFTFPLQLSFILDIFYLPGEPISLQSLRCSPLEVVHYIFMGYCLHLCEWVRWVGLDSRIIHILISSKLFMAKGLHRVGNGCFYRLIAYGKKCDKQGPQASQNESDNAHVHSVGETLQPFVHGQVGYRPR